MQGHDPFVRSEGGYNAGRDGFLSDTTEPFTDPALAKENEHFLFDHPGKKQGTVEFQQKGIGKIFAIEKHMTGIKKNGRRSQSFSVWVDFLYRNEVSTESRRLNRSAHQKPSTRNPFTNLAASKMINALMTNKKRPNVNRVIGKVSMIRMGFTIRFSNPSTMARIRALTKDCMWTPLKT
jgi:hypothetical protein